MFVAEGLKQRFERLDAIGEGAFGVVHRARDKKHNNRLVALKSIRVDDGDTDGVGGNILREIALLKRMEHENIIILYEVIEETKILTLVFELMDEDFKSFLRRNRPLDADTIKTFMRQLIEGTYYLHRTRIIHRDLKPQNLLVNSKLQLKIADFGLARSVGIPVNNYTSAVITLWYRPPDVLLGEEHYSFPVDLWSIGCIFAEMAHGRAIFTGADEDTQLNSIFSSIGPPNNNTLPGVTKLTNWKTEYAFVNVTRPAVVSYVERLGRSAQQLLYNMLKYNPKARLTARSSLRQPYFK